MDYQSLSGTDYKNMSTCLYETLYELIMNCTVCVQQGDSKKLPPDARKIVSSGCNTMRRINHYALDIMVF